MAWAQQTDKHRSWTGMASKIIPGQTVPNRSREPFSSSEESLAAAPRVRRLRSVSAPSISPTRARRTPPLQQRPPEGPAVDASRAVAVHLSPPNTIEPSILSPEHVPSPRADVRRPSTPPTMPRSPVPHEEQIENAQRARKLARLIDRVLLKRTRVNYQDESWLRKYEYLDESAEALKIALADTNVSNVTPARLEKIAELQLQLRSDYDAIKFRNKTFRDLQNSLSNLEFRLAAKESTILDVVSSFAGRLPSDASDTESLGARTAASTKSNTPSLLKLFYERKGDEGIFLERLQEQELFYREGLVERDLVADRGDPLPMTDEQFEHDCRVQYEDILSDLLAAQKDVVRLRDQCEAAGLETEVRRPPSDDLSFSNPPPVDDDPISPPLVPHEFLQTVDGQPLLDGARPSDRPGDNVIQGWLDNVSADPIEVSDTANIALEGTTAAYDDSVCHDHETAQLSPPEKISSLPVMADNSAWLEGVTASALALEMESVQPLAATHDGLAADEKFLAEIPAASWSSRQPLP